MRVGECVARKRGGGKSLLSVKHPLVAVACLCLRPFPRCGRLISVGHQVNAPSESGLIIFYQFIATFAAEPSPC